MRNKRLDILRGVAVLVVILHHAAISTFFSKVGWVGVDLFFVLSGFLISGLLFSDYKKNKTIRLKRFLIRRGLKIYPAYYAFLLLMGVAMYVAFRSLNARSSYLYDVFFLMNYAPAPNWVHTWSLAVEEHFYIFLPLFLLGTVHYSSNREDSFRSLPRAMGVIAALCIGFRAAYVYIGTPNFDMACMATHTRMDSLFFGVLIGYFWHFRREALNRFMRSGKNRAAIWAGSIIVVASVYFFSIRERFFATFGYSFVYIACGGVLLLSLYTQGVLPPRIARGAGMAGSVMAWIGIYSYSIYLWHMPMYLWLAPLIRRVLHVSTGPYAEFGIYLAGSIAAGVVMSKLIEYPILQLRDRLFPVGETTLIAVEPRA